MQADRRPRRALRPEAAVRTSDGERRYRDYRIHVCRLVSGQYAAIIRSDSQGSPLENVPGKYRSRDEAVVAAKAHIDEMSSR